MASFSKLSDIWRAMRRRGEISAIKASGLFDPELYRLNAAAKGWHGDPIVHYVLYGEVAGLRASQSFDAEFYRAKNPDVVAGGGNLLAHWIRFGRSEGRSPRGSVAFERYPMSQASAPLNEVSLVEALLTSQRFDEAFYRKQQSEIIAVSAPVDYVRRGEAVGCMPSEDFDPTFYLSANPELADAGACAFHHFVTLGGAEGRQGLPFPSLPALLRSRLDRNKPSVLVVLHELSRSGAPILGWNIATKLKNEKGCNVVVLALSAGELAATFNEVADVVIAPIDEVHMSIAALQSVCKLLKWTLKPDYVIANSAATAEAALTLQVHGMPVIALVHEFTCVFGPDRDLRAYFGSMDVLVFPAEVVKSAALERHPEMYGRRTEIIPQGRSVVPEVIGGLAKQRTVQLLEDGARVFTVLGMGTVEWRKGVDLFVATASSFRQRFPSVPVRFLWIGALTAHPQRQEMAMFLKEQISRSGVSDIVDLEPETSDVEAAYRLADALFVSSRLDPLPNVGIDAMFLGMPVVCFDGATGLAEYLAAEPVLLPLVAPYADVHTAASIIWRLATDPGWTESVMEGAKDVANRRFDMSSYVDRLHSLGQELAPMLSSEKNIPVQI